MSKIAHSANALGTGTFTIASPNSNSDRTLTLPDETGTFVTTGSAVRTQKGVPAFSARGTTTNQAVSTATPTKVQLQAEDFDVTGAFDNVTNYRFQPNVAGYYQFNAVVRVSANSGTIGGYFAELWKNGVAHTRGNELSFSSGTYAGSLQQALVSGVIYLNGSTDYIELYGYVNGTNTAFNNATTNNAGSCFMTGILIAAA